MQRGKFATAIAVAVIAMVSACTFGLGADGLPDEILATPESPRPLPAWASEDRLASSLPLSERRIIDSTGLEFSITRMGRTGNGGPFTMSFEPQGDLPRQTLQQLIVRDGDLWDNGRVVGIVRRGNGTIKGVTMVFQPIGELITKLPGALIEVYR